MTERPPTVSEQLRADNLGLTVAELRHCAEHRIDPARFAADKRAAALAHPPTPTKEALMSTITAEELESCKLLNFDPEKYARMKALPRQYGAMSMKAVEAALRPDPPAPDPAPTPAPPAPPSADAITAAMPGMSFADIKAISDGVSDYLNQGPK